MRIEELANNQFIKGTDSVERYLLNIIKQYFNSNNIETDSREYIINKAVERIKQELEIDNAGVISINGQTGEVNITLDSLGGEPLIVPKYSAFNVSFGTEKETACEGNDPRLYDKRQPLKHYHQMSEINGLEGMLSSIKNNIGTLSGNTHSHVNYDVLSKLVYTGDKSQIDLTLLDSVESKTGENIINANNAILNAQTDINNLISRAINELEQYDEDYNNIRNYIDTKNIETENNLKKYCDTEYQKKKNEIDAELNKKISKEKFNNIINALNQSFSVLYETNITNFIISNNFDVNNDINLPDEITSILYGLSEAEYKICFYIQYSDPATNRTVITTLPFIYVEASKILYTVRSELINKSIIRINTTRAEDILWSDFINNAMIKLRISIKNKLPEV